MTDDPTKDQNGSNSEEPQVQFPDRSQRLISVWVLAVGAFGGWFIKLVPLKGVDVSHFSWWQCMLIGAVGAFLTVFYAAKTDLRKFWNVICLALVCGISGPSIIEGIIKSGSTSTSSASEAKDAVTSSLQLTEKAKNTDPSVFQKQVDETTQKATSSLHLFGVANQANPGDKEGELAKTEAQLKEVLQNLDAATDHSPNKILPAVAEIANLAKESGANAVASQAQQIIAKAQDSDKDAVRQAANAPELSRNSATLYFITPETLTDSGLLEIQNQISAQFPRFKILPAVHPKATMEPGIEVVYYNNNDESTAQKLLEYVKKYSGTGDGRMRLEKTKDGSQPSQIDIHIGPNIAGHWPGNPAATSPTPQPATTSTPSPPQPTPVPVTKRRTKAKR